MKYFILMATLVATCTADVVQAALIAVPHQVIAKRDASVNSPYGPDVTIQSTQAPSINNRGDVLFTSKVKGQNITSYVLETALLVSRNGSLRTVAHAGETLPGNTLPLVNISNQGIIDDNGLVSFRANSFYENNSRFFQSGLWAESAPGSLTKLSGNTVTNGNHSNGNRVDYQIHGGSGDIVAIALNSTTNSNNNIPIGIYSGDAVNGISIQVQKGDPANGLGGTNEFVSFLTPTVNGNGDYFFTAHHPTTSGASTGHHGLWGGTESGGLTNIAASNLPANERALGATWSSISSVVSNDQNDLAFLAGFNVPSPTGLQFERGVYTKQGNDIQEMWIFDEQMQVGGETVSLDYANGIIINGAGEVASYVTEVNSSNHEKTAIYRRDGSGDIVRVARDGDAAPGMASGVIFDVFLQNNTPVVRNGLFMNEAGALVFKAFLRGTGITDSNNEVIYLSTSDGNLIPILQEGDLIDVSTIDGLVDARNVFSMSLPQNTYFSSDAGSGGEDGRRSPINDRGQLVLDISYTSGDGIFMFDLPGAAVEIPEPSTCLLTSLGLLLIRRRK